MRENSERPAAEVGRAAGGVLDIARDGYNVAAVSDVTQILASP